MQALELVSVPTYFEVRFRFQALDTVPHALNSYVLEAILLVECLQSVVLCYISSRGSV